MTRLFNREWSVRVDTLRVDGLDVAFEVEKSIRPEPNVGMLRIWNLTRSHQAQLQALSVRRQTGSGRIRVELVAGYAGESSLIFRGDLRSAVTVRDGGDRVVELEGEDGGRSVLWSRVNRSFPPGTSVHSVVRACAQALGVGMGNADELLRDARMASGGVFAGGTTISGSAARELTELLRSCGLNYSIQNGVLQITRRGQPLQATAVRLTPESGLVGDLQKNVDGTVSATSLMMPDLYPGRRVVFDSEVARGGYQVTRAKYYGDTAGSDWNVDVECVAA